MSPRREEPEFDMNEVDLEAEAQRIFDQDLADPAEVLADIESLGPQPGDETVVTWNNRFTLEQRSLHAKLADLRANFGFVGKTGTNTGVGGGYKFVEATEISRRFVQMASERGLTMLPAEMMIADMRPTASGKQTVYTISTLWQITDVETGEVVHIPSMGQGADSADKALPKAQTNAMKYAILLLLQAAGDDPENDPRTDALENTPEGPGVNVGPSNVPGVRQGGRQTEVTQVQMDAIRREARRLDLSPESFALLIGSALGGKLPEIDDKESVNEQQRAILAFCGELTFDEAGTLIQYLETTPAIDDLDGPEADIGAQ